MKGTGSRQALHICLLFLTAMIWGAAFVAQSAGNVMGPFTFNCLRNGLGVLVLIPFMRFFYGNLHLDRDTLKGGICCGLCLFAASNLQQVGLQYTTPGKSGFITASYMILVPIAGFFLGRGIQRRILLAVLLGAAGLYFLCMPGGEGIGKLNQGDVMSFLCAFFYTAQILCIDRFSKRAEGVKMACIQFLTAAVLGAGLMLAFESPSLPAIRQGLLPLLYAGALSSGVGYTLQIVGQKTVDPSIAALIMSLESCFAVLSGWLLLGDRLDGREFLGCVLMFGAIILTQLPEKRSHICTES